jgi:aspartyl-tRNA(Asn)/glutamyl-tRNA(Gln) amidotransferase subunit A
MHVTGQRTQRGSLLYRDAAPSEIDSPVVQRVRAAGGIIIGKTTTPEYGWKGATDSPLSGITRNPHDLARTPGGSSGGASAALAAGLGPLAVGTDGAGSVRIPGALTGVVGFKQSAGRVPNVPHSAMTALAHVSPMARCVRDAALLLDVMVGAHPADPLVAPHDGTRHVAACDGDLRGLRIGFSADFGYTPMDPSIAAQVRTHAHALAHAGAQVEELEGVLWPDPAPLIHTLWSAGIGGALRDISPAQRALLDPGLHALIETARSMGPFDHARAGQDRITFSGHVARIFERIDVLITPTLPCVAWPVDGPFPFEPDGQSSASFRYTPLTFPFNLTGQPAITIPCGHIDGLPIGLQVIGQRWADALVLRVAACAEAVIRYPLLEI